MDIITSNKDVKRAAKGKEQENFGEIFSARYIDLSAAERQMLVDMVELWAGRRAQSRKPTLRLVAGGAA